MQLAILLGAVWTGIATAQNVQVNYTICNWSRLRGGVVRDALYLDGGQLWWQTAFADGTTPVTSSDGNVAGNMFQLNFSVPFDTTTTNLSALFTKMPKAGGAGNNIAPNYIDGTMFVNDDELYLYGGLPRLTDSASPQSGDTVLGYEAYQYGTYRSSWSPGFYQNNLPAGVTRYITNGAGASAPSENLGWYFSGMRSPDWGPIYYDDSSANATANTLIQVDMSTMRGEKWTNTTLPDNITPRANAELVWVPVSDHGVLVAIGGVSQPEEIYPAGLTAAQTAQSQSQSPTFMTSLPVYDVSSSSWYLQNTTGDAPPQLTEFCSVVAAANDSSSYNVYIYGGYDGLNAAHEPSDDVWILSIPSFQWIKAYSGSASHGRSGHVCVAPYPDQMFIVGGIHQNQAECVEGGIIQVFNLNTLKFQNTYAPGTWSSYKVPDIVTAAIGGNSQGGASKTATWSAPNLSSIFTKKYAAQVSQYYPYASSSNATTASGTSGTTSADPNTQRQKKSGGKNHTLAIVLGIVGGLVVLTLLLVIFLLMRRRRILRSSTSSNNSVADGRKNRISNWLNGTPPPTQGKSSESTVSPEMEQTSPTIPFATAGTALGQRQSPTHSQQSSDQSHEMPAVERPKPPFEMATEYNNHPSAHRAGVIDYAYTPSSPSQPSQSQSQSSSSNYDPNTPYRHHPDDVGHVPPSPPWPLPAAPATTWRDSNNTIAAGTHQYTTLPSQSRNNLPSQRRTPQHNTNRSQYRREDSSSSGIGTLPSSGEGSLPQDEETRQSYLSPVSPVTPVDRHSNGRIRSGW